MKTGFYIDSGNLGGPVLGILGADDRAHASGSGRVRGKATNGSNVMMGEGLMKVELQTTQSGRVASPVATHSCMDQQHRTTISVLQYARSKLSIFIDSEVLAGTFSDVLGGKDWALERKRCWVRQSAGSTGSNICWGRGWIRESFSGSETAGGFPLVQLADLTGNTARLLLR